MTVYARLSANRKYVVCGECRGSLCRRDERSVPGGLAQEVDGRRVPGTQRVWRLAWEDGWHIVDDHIELWPHVRERLGDDRKPIRHDWTDAERFALSRALRQYIAARCPACRQVNVIDPKRLRVNGIAAH
jgi:hypothetical protein